MALLGYESDAITVLPEDVDGTRRLTGRYRGHKKVIVLALDDCKSSMQAIQFYLDTLHRPEHLLVLVHAVEAPYSPMQVHRKDIIENTQRKVKEETRNLLASFKKFLYNKNVEYCTLCEAGEPGQLVVRVTQEQNACMAVVGSRGLGKIKRTLLGSVSDHVLKHAQCNVLICNKTGKK